MDLPQSAVTEFQELYLKQHGISLSDVEAKELASELIGFYKDIQISHNAENRQQ